VTADLTASAERALTAGPEREQLAAAPDAVKPTLPWVVVRQSHIGGEVVDTVESHHRWEWLAEWSARRKTNRDAGRHGAYFNARRAEQ
jgi:hypothetical protein